MLCTAALYASFVAIDLSRHHHAYWFAHVGKRSLESGSSSSRITPALGWESPLGYDGQYYFFLALDPRHAKDYMLGSAGYVGGYIYSRPVYPGLARLAALGSAKRIPAAMLGINLLAVGTAVFALAMWLRARAFSPWWAFLYASFPGVIFCVARDLTEPLGYAFVALALLAFDRRKARRIAAAAALLALAGLTRETTLLFALGPAVSLALFDVEAPGRSWVSLATWRRPVAFLVATVLPLFAWRAVVASYLHTSTQEQAGGLGALVPFHGLAAYWPWHGEHLLIAFAVVLPTVASILCAALVIGRRLHLEAALLVLVNAAALVVFLPTPVDVDYGSAGRAAIGVLVASILCVPVLRRQPRRSYRLVGRMTAVLWSAVWFLYVCALLGLPGVNLPIS
jgi:hypothetical protein